MADDINVQLLGYSQTRAALKQFAPDLQQQMDKTINKVAGRIVRDARGFVPAQAPLSGWQRTGRETGISLTDRARAFPKYDQGEIIKGIRVSRAKGKRNRKGFINEIGISNNSAAGSIYETAGTNNPNGSPESQSRNRNAGNQFIGAISNAARLNRPLHKLVVPAVIRHRKDVEAGINEAIKVAEHKFQARVGETGARLARRAV